jgi:hypothetical protein
MNMKQLVAGATIAAALGVTATGIGAGAAYAAPARPPAFAGQASHGMPAPQGNPGGPGGSPPAQDHPAGPPPPQDHPAGPPPPQDHPGGPSGPPADTPGPNDHGGRPPGQGGGDFRGQWHGAPWGDGAPPWGWGAPPRPAWSGPIPPAWGPPPPPFDYWGYTVTPVWDSGFNQWGFWLFGVWIPL